jgi:hypothetical protein
MTLFYSAVNSGIISRDITHKIVERCTLFLDVRYVFGSGTCELLHCCV